MLSTAIQLIAPAQGQSVRRNKLLMYNTLGWPSRYILGEMELLAEDWQQFRHDDEAEDQHQRDCSDVQDSANGGGPIVQHR